MINMPEWQRCLDAQFGSPKPGQYRAQPEDFWVDEQLDFTLKHTGNICGCELKSAIKPR